MAVLRVLCLLLVALLGVGGVVAFPSCGGGGGAGDEPPPEDPQYPPGVARVDLCLTDEDPALLSVTGDDGITCWLFGVRDARGVPQRVTEMHLTSGNEPVGSVSFDERQRVTGVARPDGASVDVLYGGGEAEVTVVTATGASETVVVPDPYPVSALTYFVDDLCAGILGTPDSRMYLGDILVCDPDTPPLVLISAYDPVRKETVQQRAAVRQSTLDPERYTYYYYVNITDDFDAWQDYCLCAKAAGAVVIGASLYSEPIGLATSLGQYLIDLHAAVQMRAIDEVVVATLEGMAESILSGSTSLLYGAGNWLAGSDLPCSRSRYDGLQALYRQPFQIFARDHLQQQQAGFQPDGVNQVLPGFEFTDRCCEGVTNLKATLVPAAPLVGQPAFVTATVEPVVPGCTLRFEVYDPLLSIYHVTVDNQGVARLTVPWNGDYPDAQRAVAVFDNAGHRVSFSWVPKDW